MSWLHIWTTDIHFAQYVVEIENYFVKSVIVILTINMLSNCAINTFEITLYTKITNFFV